MTSGPLKAFPLVISVCSMGHLRPIWHSPAGIGYGCTEDVSPAFARGRVACRATVRAATDEEQAAHALGGTTALLALWRGGDQ